MNKATESSAHSISTHRVIQLADLADRASTNRVAYYCRAIKASSINNQGAALYFADRARRFEQIRARITARLSSSDSGVTP
jgi:hypothetical protein